MGAGHRGRPVSTVPTAEVVALCASAAILVIMGCAAWSSWCTASAPPPRRLEKVSLIADLLRRTSGRETELVALYLSGTLPQGRIGVGWRTIQRPFRGCPPPGRR